MAYLRFPEAVFLDVQKPEMMARISEGLILLDEGQIMADARAWAKIPSEVLQAWAQLRKNRLDMFYTTQGFEHVDTRLRDLTAEVIRFKRAFGRWVWVFKHVPGKKEIISKKLVKLDSSIFRLYDTFEKIGNQGIGVGIPVSQSLAAVRAMRTVTREHRTTVESAEAYFGREPLTYRRGRVVEFTRATQEAYEYLHAEGVIQRGMLIKEAVRHEMGRRAWLSEFRLRGEEVPISTTYYSPFMTGWGPEEVRQANEEEERRGAATTERRITDLESELRALKRRRLSGTDRLEEVAQDRTRVMRGNGVLIGG
jgi:hypothetical protein